jgi:hypothetical protein
MTASNQPLKPHRSFRPFVVLIVVGVCTGSVAADDAETAKLLKSKGVEITESKGVATGLNVHQRRIQALFGSR